MTLRLPAGRLVALAAAVAVLAGPAMTALADPVVAIEDTMAPGEPVARDFPADFLPLLPVDAQYTRASEKDWSDPRVGGWGGTLSGGASCAGSARKSRGGKALRPVVFVHGNTSDAEFWRTAGQTDGAIEDVRARFLAAGYSPCELWAVSYDGAPGYFTYNDINVEEVFTFVSAVREHLGAAEIDLVSHSLGVTVLRKAALRHPEMYDWVRTFVGIAGANHGTTTCRGRGFGGTDDSYVCEETEPGSAWLAELNRGPGGAGEAPPGPRYLTMYEGTGLVDSFYLGPDAGSPRLEAPGVCNHQVPSASHQSLAVERSAVSYYLAFLRDGRCR